MAQLELTHWDVACAHADEARQPKVSANKKLLRMSVLRNFVIGEVVNLYICCDNFFQVPDRGGRPEETRPSIADMFPYAQQHPSYSQQPTQQIQQETQQHYRRGGISIKRVDRVQQPQYQQFSAQQPVPADQQPMQQPQSSGRVQGSWIGGSGGRGGGGWGGRGRGQQRGGYYY